MPSIVLPLLTTLIFVGLGCSLGIWQLHRLTWKTALLARIDAAERAPPVPLPGAPNPFEKIIVRGRLDARGALAYLDDVRDDPNGNAVMGTHLIEPLLRPGKLPVLVDLGWMRYPPHPLAGDATVTGYIRAPEHPNWLSARDDPRRRRFYTLDPARMAAAVGLGTAIPFTVVALGPGGVPDPARSLPRPPNNHLQYAITWFGLALVAAAMFAFWVRGARRA